MSAFLCSPTHVLAVALAVHAIDGTPVQPTARALRALNNASLQGRYGRDATARLYASSATIERAQRWLGDATPADCYALAKCISHQCDNAPADHPARAALAHCLTILSTASGGLSSTNVWSI